MKLSTIIPTYNESQNISRLIYRIDKVLKKLPYEYQILVVDDHSSDMTAQKVKNLSKKYPVKFHLKEGKKGKAYSIIEGIQKSKGGLIAMIDGDLQYPPEALSKMLGKIEKGADMVIARRRHKTSWIRNLFSRGFNLVFCKYLHGLPFDVQSGLKLFKRSSIDLVHFNSTPWTFDLDLLIQLKNTGHIIEEIPILFKERQKGISKVNLLKTSYEIGSYALKRKFFVPPAPVWLGEAVTSGRSFLFKGKKYTTHSDLDIEESALTSMTSRQTAVSVLLLATILTALSINWVMVLTIIIACLTVLYFTDIFFNLFLILRSLTREPEFKINLDSSDKILDKDLPKYTILCPLYKEWQVLPQFVEAINKLDYPKDKLQVLLLLEEDDKETVQQALAYDLPSHFQIEVVPHALPKTKPKACNYGLNKATGLYTVIYDAEDIPETDQLKKVATAFKTTVDNIVCIQAKLNFYNPHQNILTKLFTAEYSLWFDLVLPGLQSIDAPIPLGGTSNHFKTSTLKDLKGWDPFNVTEDCDLGIRLSKKGFKTAVIESTTYEEANSDAKNWLWQRSRWIKGYIQTFLVHNRNLKEFFQNGSGWKAVMFQLVVGGKVLSVFINPFMWLLTIIYFSFRTVIGPSIEQLFPSPILYMGVFSIVVGNFLYFYYYMIACGKRGKFELVKWSYLVPFYWLFMSVSAWVALYKLITVPHQWSKTQHGLHLKATPEMATSTAPQRISLAK